MPTASPPLGVGNRTTAVVRRLMVTLWPARHTAVYHERQCGDPRSWGIALAELTCAADCVRRLDIRADAGMPRKVGALTIRSPDPGIPAQV